MGAKIMFFFQITKKRVVFFYKMNTEAQRILLSFSEDTENNIKFPEDKKRK